MFSMIKTDSANLPFPEHLCGQPPIKIRACRDIFLVSPFINRALHLRFPLDFMAYNHMVEPAWTWLILCIQQATWMCTTAQSTTGGKIAPSATAWMELLCVTRSLASVQITSVIGDGRTRHIAEQVRRDAIQLQKQGAANEIIVVACWAQGSMVLFTYDSAAFSFPQGWERQDWSLLPVAAASP